MGRLAYVVIDPGTQQKCFSPDELAIHEGDQCIVQIERALEFGRIMKIEPATEDGRNLPTVVRCATLQDQAKANENVRISRMAMETCAGRAAAHQLPIKLIRVRYSFDRSVLKVLFSSEKHVDARELVKDVGGELHVRVETRQVGVRDQAGMIGGMGPCGRRLCCCTWLHNFDSVNVKMAKTQRLSLNPSSISGNCGRLKCCLRYEYDQYREMGRSLPRQGARVACDEGDGVVVGVDVLKGSVRIILDDQRVVEHEAEGVREIWAQKENRQEEHE
jgi:cell fate regulator YaaT (PSP1 superfamily)